MGCVLYGDHGELQLGARCSYRAQLRRMANEERILEDISGMAFPALRDASDEVVDQKIPHILSHPRRYREFIAASDGWPWLAWNNTKRWRDRRTIHGTSCRTYWHIPPPRKRD